MHGNNLGTHSRSFFLWKTLKEGGEATQNSKLVTELSQGQQVYSTRKMRWDFIEWYTGWESCKACRRSIWHDEPDILLTLKTLNGKPNATSINKSWEELLTYLENIYPAVNDCRHGSTLHMPTAISIGDLRDNITERLHTRSPEEEPSLPFSGWVKLQFAPRIPYSSNSLHRTGRFEVKFTIQIWQLRKSHPDLWYVLVGMKYARSMLFAFLNTYACVCSWHGNYTSWRA